MQRKHKQLSDPSRKVRKTLSKRQSFGSHLKLMYKQNQFISDMDKA